MLGFDALAETALGELPAVIISAPVVVVVRKPIGFQPGQEWQMLDRMADGRPYLPNDASFWTQR